MKVAQAFANCKSDDIKALLAGGKLVIYSVARPATADHPVERSGILATFTFASPAFAADQKADGTEPAAFESNPVVATGVGTPGFARAFKPDGATAVADFSVGPGDCEIKLSEVSTTPDYPIALKRFTLPPAID